MFWDRAAGLYDLFENVYNKKVYRETGESVAAYIGPDDAVLECACGTGAISVSIAPRCKKLVASDYSEGMLKQARKKLARFGNVVVERQDITALRVADNAFDAVVAGNVVHLLPDPEAAMRELTRVCRDGGRLIIPTYINDSAGTSKRAVGLLKKLGADFKRQFDAAGYRAFFEKMGYTDVRHEIVDGRMACDIAVIQVKKAGKGN